MGAAIDGHDLDVQGVGLLKFELWGQIFSEEVQTLGKLPYKLLIGRKFWRRHPLRLHLTANCGSVKVNGTWLSRRIKKATPSPTERIFAQC